MMQTYNQSRGFNLIELLVVLGIVSVFASVAIPAMRSLYQSTVVKAETGDLIAALYLARGEAIKRRMTIVICPSVDERHCTTGTKADDWRNGWIVRAGEEILRSKNKLVGDVRVSGDSPTMIRYEANGVSDLKTGVSLCGRDSQEGRQVRVTNTGRPYSAGLMCTATT